MEDTPEGKADRVINTLRKSEARSEFTTAILGGFRQYFGEILHQGSPPELIQQFNDREGIIFPVGSFLRGTARVGSDFDFILVFDSSLAERSVGHLIHTEFEDITVSSEEFHPSGIPFRYWLARRFKEDPQLVKFYDQLRSLMEEYTEIGNQYRSERGLLLNTFKEEDIERRFIVSEALVFNTENLVQNIEGLAIIQPAKSSKDRDVRINDLYGISNMGVLIPQLLTTNLDYVVEGYPGALLHHQQRIVKALDHLEKQNPDVFQDVYAYLSDNFHVAVNFQSDNHPHFGSIDIQFREYVEKSGRFPSEKTEHAAKLLKGVKRQIIFPSLKSFKEKYLVGISE